MDQTIINFVLGGFGAIIGFMLKALWQTVNDLQVADHKLAEKVAEIEVLVAGDYVRRDHLQQTIDAIFKKLDKMDMKMDRMDDKKADKYNCTNFQPNVRQD